MKKKLFDKRRFDNDETKESGFTFVETLAVLAVGAILAAGATVSAIKVIASGRKASANQSIAQYKIALQTYYVDCGQFPSSQQGLEALWKKPVLVPIPQNWKGPYVETEIKADPWGTDFIYSVKGNVSFPADVPENMPFVIISYGADGVAGGENENEDICSWK